jgi:hypothetical protein
MPMNQDAAPRTLDAIADLVDLLRLAHSAAHRAESELAGSLFSRADEISQQLHSLRQTAHALQQELDRFVTTGRSPDSSENQAPEDEYTEIEQFGGRRVWQRTRDADRQR